MQARCRLRIHFRLRLGKNSCQRPTCGTAHCSALSRSSSMAFPPRLMDSQMYRLSPLPTFSDSEQLQYTSTPMPESPHIPLPFSIPDLASSSLLGPLVPTGNLRLQTNPAQEWSNYNSPLYSPCTAAAPSTTFPSPRLAPDRNMILSLSVSDLLIHPFCSGLHSQVQGALGEIMRLNTEIRFLQSTIATL